ncbi:MAG: NAD(P)-binding protein [Oscillospiraceae bacterium]|jgi:Fe-S oxidoreductase|nr:NAD(P)-binding protein [Oscillospiraceae bacterium]
MIERLNLSKLQAEEITSLSASCVAGAPPPCARKCPFGLDVRSFTARAEKGRWQVAYKSFRDAVVFPELVSRLCPAPCAGACSRSDVGGAIDLPGLERAVTALATDKRRDSYAIPRKAGSVAVVGAGAAGLSAALSLAVKRCGVTVFERGAAWGGALRALPDFDVFDAEFSAGFLSLDVNFRFNSEIHALSELSEFDAVYLATGDGGESFGLFDSFDSTLLTTAQPRVFLGGGLVGAELMTAIAHGRLVARSVETFFQIGRATAAADASVCSWTPDTTDIAPVQRLVPSDGSGVFTDSEARAEAARCLKCDCDICLQGCEMLRRFHKLPMKIASEVYTDIGANPPYSSHTITREAYSCSNCGYCKRRCPESIDVGELLRVSRRARVEGGSAPPALHDYWLREMDFSSSDAFTVLPPRGKTTAEYVFFPGCQLGAYNPDYVTRSFAALQNVFDVGLFLGCCGAPAYWAGDDTRLIANSEKIREAWRLLGEPKFIFACSTCASLFAELFPEIEGVSLYPLLAESVAYDTGGTTAPFGAASVFDPCSAAEDEAARAAVRTLASGRGAALTELEESGKCCGYGGHIRLANPSLYEEITSGRVAVGELPYIVYCVNCLAVFSERGKKCAHILDVAFGLKNSIGQGGAGMPDIDTRRKNSLEVKRLMVRELGADGSDFIPERDPWDDIELIIDPETAERVDRKLISLSDIREALYLARESGGFFTASDGTRQCSMLRTALVYWVHYREPREGVYEILDAYYHRMKFSEGEADE